VSVLLLVPYYHEHNTMILCGQLFMEFWDDFMLSIGCLFIMGAAHKRNTTAGKADYFLNELRVEANPLKKGCSSNIDDCFSSSPSPSGSNPSNEYEVSSKDSSGASS